MLRLLCGVEAVPRLIYTMIDGNYYLFNAHNQSLFNFPFIQQYYVTQLTLVWYL
jgi:hypothetical protein